MPAIHPICDGPLPLPPGYTLPTRPTLPEQLQILGGKISSLEVSNTQLQGGFADLESRTCTLETAVNTAQGISHTQSQPDSAEPGDLHPIIGSFDSSEVVTGSKSWTSHGAKTVQFSRQHATPPGIVIGFSKLDLSSAHNMRVTTYACNILNRTFDINVDGCDATLSCGIDCNWLEISAKNRDIQFGRYNTHDHAPWTTARQENQRNVTFQRPYSSPPKVLVWLSAFDMDRNKSWRLEAYANDTTPSGFRIHIDCTGDTVLRSAVLSWVAYPRTVVGMVGGMFDTTAMRPSNCPQPYNSGYITFPASSFSAPPRVIVVISAIDINPNTPMKLAASISSLSATGMSWHLNSGVDTVLFYARASYIALE